MLCGGSQTSGNIHISEATVGESFCEWMLELHTPFSEHKAILTHLLNITKQLQDMILTSRRQQSPHDSPTDEARKG